MTAQNRTVLKSYFQRGLRPTQDQYVNLIDSFILVSAGVSANYLETTGGVMTGRLQLAGVPVSALEAVNKGYVDAIVSAGGVIPGGSNGQIQYNNSGSFGGLTVSGDATLLSTGALTLSNTAVSAGTYNLATITFDSKGRATSASSGSSGTNIKSVGTQIFISSGTYTPSAGMAYCIAEVIGGGGGGGSTGGSQNAGGGGGSGGYSRKVLSAATVGASQSVTIGAGGGGATAGGSGGSAGGTTSLGALLSATGGSGGSGADNNSFHAGGNGGIGSSGDINQTGGAGIGITGLTGISLAGGPGGNSYFGGGGKSISGTTGGNGATNSGGGGGGAGGNSQAGGNGADGIIIVTEFLTI